VSAVMNLRVLAPRSHLVFGAGVAQSVLRLTTDRTTRFYPQQRQKIFPLASGSRPALGPTQPRVQWYEGLFPGDKARLVRDDDYSPPSSAEVENEQEVYLLPRLTPAWCVV
jgi:hypothetical protein